jgi:penicillin-binding protein 2
VRSRVVFGAIAVVLLIGVLIARLYFLQVIQYDYHSTLSENNRVHVQPIPPTRGLIFDRNGVVVADNRPSFSLSMTRERSGDWQQVLDVIVEVLQLTPEDRVIFEKRMRRGAGRSSRCRSVRADRRADRPDRGEPVPPAGVEVVAQLVRHYPQGAHFAHSVGYMGRINEKELKPSTRSTTAAPTTSARPASSVSTSPNCTARWVTKKSRPTPAAACCGCSSAPIRFPARTSS